MRSVPSWWNFQNGRMILVLVVHNDFHGCVLSAGDKSAVTRRTPQEIMDEDFNKPNFNNNHAETRRHVPLAALDPEGKSIIGVPDVETDLLCEDYADLYQAIKHLKPQQRELLRKVFWQGMKQVEIAREEGLAKNTISDRMTRIYQRLRKNLPDRKNFF